MLSPAQIALAVSLMVSQPGTLGADKEAVVRAAFLYRLSFFVQWPDADGKELRLCLGASTPEATRLGLQQQTRQKTIHGRQLIVADLAEPQRCDILYLNQSEAQAIEVSNRALVVVDSVDALRSHGQLALVKVKQRGEETLVFHGDRSRLQQAKFSLSAQLMKLVRFGS